MVEKHSIQIVWNFSVEPESSGYPFIQPLLSWSGDREVACLTEGLFFRDDLALWLNY